MLSHQPLILPASYDQAPTQSQTERHSAVGRKGDLVVELHFGHFTDHQKREAALFVYARDPKRGVFIPLQLMWAWNEMAAARNMMATDLVSLAEQVYGFATQMDCMRLLDAVMEFMEDLKNSPLPPKGQCKNLDYFLEEVDRATEGGHMFYEVNGERVKMGG